MGIVKYLFRRMNREGKVWQDKTMKSMDLIPTSLIRCSQISESLKTVSLMIRQIVKLPEEEEAIEVANQEPKEEGEPEIRIEKKRQSTVGIKR